MQLSPSSALPVPRYRAQHETARPDAGYPHLGRDELDHAHAIYCIARSLAQLGLSSWLPTIVHWLGHYDGLETMLEDQYDPAICVRQVLLRHAMQHAPNGAAAPVQDLRSLQHRIVSDLIALDFVSYCAYWGEPLAPRAHWLPLEQPWLSFRYGREGDEQLCAWYTEDAQAYVDELSAFLLSDSYPADAGLV